MAQLETSFYANQQAPDLGKIGEGFERGLRIGDMMKQRKIEEQERLAKKPLEDQKRALEMQRGQAELIANAALGSKDQASYTNNLNILKQKGIDLTGVPDIYDPGLVNTYGNMALESAKRIENQLNSENMALRREDQKLDRQYKYANMQQTRLDRQDRLDEKRTDKEFKLTTPYGLANSETDAKDLKAAFESKQSLDNKLEQMISLREKHEGGALLNREDVARAKQLSQDALLEYKNLAKLGVLSSSDEAIINAIIPKDPLEYRSPVEAVSGQDAILANLKAFKQDKQKDFETRIQTRLRDGKSVVDQIKKEDMPPKPQIGVEQDGYVFIGGDPADAKSWRKK